MEIIRVDRSDSSAKVAARAHVIHGQGFDGVRENDLCREFTSLTLLNLSLPNQSEAQAESIITE